MSLTLTYTFANHGELAAHLAHFTRTEGKGEVAAPVAAPKPEKAKPPAPSSALAAAPTPQATEAAKPASQTASTPSADSGAALSYATDVKPLVIKVGATKGRETVLAILGTFKAAKGDEVGADDLPAFKAALEDALKG